MDVLQFDGGRMKISLTKEELALYDIDFSSEEDNSEKIRETIETALTLVRIKTGFLADREENYIQLFPCRDGGCEIFVLKKDKEGSAALLPAPRKERAGAYLCVFREESRARAVKKQLLSIGEDAALYVDETHKEWYLISELSVSGVLFLEEFGQKAIFDPTPYLREHFGAEKI